MRPPVRRTRTRLREVQERAILDSNQWPSAPEAGRPIVQLFPIHLNECKPLLGLGVIGGGRSLEASNGPIHRRVSALVSASLLHEFGSAPAAYLSGGARFELLLSVRIPANRPDSCVGGELRLRRVREGERCRLPQPDELRRIRSQAIRRSRHGCRTTGASDESARRPTARRAKPGAPTERWQNR